MKSGVRALSILIIGASAIAAVWDALRARTDIPEELPAPAGPPASRETAAAVQGGFAGPERVEQQEDTRSEINPTGDEWLLGQLRAIAARNGTELPRPIKLSRAGHAALKKVYVETLPRRIEIERQQTRALQKLMNAKVEGGEYEDHSLEHSCQEAREKLWTSFAGQRIVAASPPDRYTIRIVRLIPGEDRRFDELAKKMKLLDMEVLQAVLPFFRQETMK
ncbi:MAG: hypothetical protein ACE5F1_22525 [Planctomycetota bacterium]